jgi:hydroxymethylpyrimidine/phosphomethylpyrimidine kinase
VPAVVAIGGLDSSGGSGLVRDFITASDLGARVVLIPTAWTLQSLQGLHKIDERAPGDTRQAVEAALAALAPGSGAVKIGMTASPATIRAIIEALAGFAGPVVFDPVLTTSTGRPLFEGTADQLLPLAARATLLTPNAREAAALTNRQVSDLDGARAAAADLRQGGARAVLVKGGHLAGDEAIDLLVDDAGEARFPAPRVPGKDPRGTGCALATAIAVELGRGRPLRAAVGSAKAWLHARIAAAVERDGAHWL